MSDFRIRLPRRELFSWFLGKEKQGRQTVLTLMTWFISTLLIAADRDDPGQPEQSTNAYQDFQKFLGLGVRIGLQHDPLLYGAYNLNPFLLRVEEVPMVVIEQGLVAVIKAYVGLPTQDTSGAEFKFGSLVRPGHRGIWQDPLRTGKYPINPRLLSGGDRADVHHHAELGRGGLTGA